jgi:hypothetical protein
MLESRMLYFGEKPVLEHFPAKAQPDADAG